MLHAILLFFKVFLVVWGIVICVLLLHWVQDSVRGDKRVLAITVIGLLVMLVIVVDGACRMYHLPRHVFPHQAQIAHGIDLTLKVLMIPLLLLDLHDKWRKRQLRKGHKEQGAPMP